jgi:hypothetical protein
LRNAEQRITDAFPVSESVRKTLARVEGFLAKERAGKALFEDEYETRLRLRALTCSQGKEPSWFASTQKIRESLPQDCFTKADEELHNWLQLRVMRYLLQAPPLRPIPDQAPKILSSSYSFSTLRFAAQAGVMLNAAGRYGEIIDIGTDQSLAKIEDPETFGSVIDISANGRVFIMGPSPKGVLLRESESGEVLASLPEHNQFQFLDATAALMVRKDSRGTDVLDLQTGTMDSAKGLSGAVRVWPVRGAANQFVVLGYSGLLSRVQVNRVDGKVHLALLDQRRATGDYSSGSTGELSADGRFVYQVVKNDVWRTELATLSTERLPIDGMQVMYVAPLADPDKLLLRVRISQRGDSRVTVVYSLSEQNFAPVEEGELAARESALRIFSVPTLNSVGVTSNTTNTALRLVQEVKTSLRYAGPAFNAYMAEQAQAWDRQLAEFEAKTRGYGAEAAPAPYADRAPVAPISAQPYDASLAKAAATSRIEAIGVYEPERTYSGKGPTAGVGSRSSYTSKPITVIVRPADKPIVLVLASYEQVDWRLAVTSPSQLKAVLIAGPGQSTVTGMNDVRVVNIGRLYAYQRGSSEFEQLAREVTRWTGKSIDAFQGVYTGKSFMVGGR